MSQINVNTISDKDKTMQVPVSTVVQGTAKAWATLDGVSPGVRRAFNIASITRVSGGAAGAYRIVFSTPMQDADYSVVVGVSCSASTPAMVQIFGEANAGYTAPTVNGFSIVAFRPNEATYQLPITMCLAVYR